MAPELGVFALILAFLLSLAQAFFALVGAWRAKPSWMAVARPAVTGQFVFVATAFACLVYSFVTDDFSVAYVAHNSNSHLPLFYKVAALWGAHEGSLLLWIQILSIWSVAVAAFSRQLPIGFSSRVLGVMGLVSSGFLLFTLWDLQSVSTAHSGVAGRRRFETLCCRISRSRFIRPCCTPGMSAFPWPSPLPARPCSKGASIRPGPNGRGRGRFSPGFFKPSASRSAVGGRITN